MNSPHDVPIENRLFVEVGWEVCWQLGGIYTVLRSKAPVTMERWGGRYCLLGPYNKATTDVEFEPLPRLGYFGRAVERLQQRGVHAHYGRWLITGKPQVVLIDYLKSWDRLADSKYLLWKDHHIDPGDEREVNDVVLFGYLAADFFDCLAEVVREGDPDADSEAGHHHIELPILAQFHEWMAGVPIPVLRHRRAPLATVFTTHATLLGRYLASDDPNFYHHLDQIDPGGAARSKGIYPRFAIERAATWASTVFTTVSQITGHEAEHFLGRKPDCLLPNGLNIQRFAALHEFQNLHNTYKQTIHEFVMGHFFPSYNWNIDKTLYIFTSGRYEYINKGYDMFIESLARLNWRLKQARSDVTVVAFLITRAATRALNVEVLQSQVLFNDLKLTCRAIGEEMQQKLLMSTAAGQYPRIDDLLDEYAQVRLKRKTHAWRRNRWPSIVTHDMVYDADDPILQQLRHCKLVNDPSDAVKVIFHPDFLQSTSPLLPLDYPDFVRGCHLGVFPSYYEPWGYTPMECVARGVPAVSSDLAGFGSYVQENIADCAAKGIKVIERRYKSFSESCDSLTSYLFDLLTMDRRERIDLRNRVEAQSVLFDWNALCRHYWQAHGMALSRYA